MKKISKNSTKVSNIRVVDLEFPDKDFPLTINVQNPQRDMGLHSHKFDELVVILEGSGVHIKDNLRRPIYAGDVFFIAPGEAHSYIGTKQLKLVNILFRGSRLFPICGKDSSASFEKFINSYSWKACYESFKVGIKLRPEKLLELHQHIETIISEFKNHKVSSQLFILARFYDILAIISQEYLISGKLKRSSENRLSEVLNHIQKHYRENIQIKELCAKAAMSRSTFFREFRRHYALSPLEYINHLRIFAAMNEILNTPDKLSIKELSFKCGFSDSNYFTRQYKAIIGETPRETMKTAAKENRNGFIGKKNCRINTEPEKSHGIPSKKEKIR